MVTVPGVPAEVAPVRPGEELDWDALAAHLRRNLDSLDGVALDGDMEVLQFPNGSANLTYLVAFGDQHLVVRRPPFGRLAPARTTCGGNTGCCPSSGAASTGRPRLPVL